MIARDDVIARIRAVPALPAAAAELIPLLQDPNYDTETICEVISHDPGLTAHVLRYANSAALNAATPVTSMRDALMRLGTKRVLSAVTCSVVAPIAMRAVSGYNLAEGSLWEKSVSVAIATEELANILGTAAPPEAFTAGLLADIGKIVLGEFVAREAGQIHEAAFRNSQSFDIAEQEVLGVNHAEAGAILLSSWHLPASIVEVVRWHHEPDRCFEGYRNIADLVHTADHICMLSGIGAGDDGTNYVASARAMTRLELSDNDVERAMCEMVCRTEEVRALFGLTNAST